MPPNASDNAKDIRDLEKKLDSYKDGHENLHRDIATSVATIEATMGSMNVALQDISKTQKDLIPIVSIIENDIPAIKKEQKENSKFRVKGMVLWAIIAVIFTALIGGGVSWMFNKIRNDKFITRDDIVDVQKFTESLTPGVAEAAIVDCDKDDSKNNGECKDD